MDENQKFGAGGAQAEQHGREQYGSGAVYERKSQASREMTLEELIRQLRPNHRAHMEWRQIRLENQIVLENIRKELSTQIEENRLLESRLADARRQIEALERQCNSLKDDKMTLHNGVNYYVGVIQNLRKEVAELNAYRQQQESRKNQAVPPPGSNGPQRPFFGPPIPPPGESAKPLTGGGLVPGDIGLGQPTTLTDGPFRVTGRIPQPTTIIPGQPGQKLRITDVERLGAAAEVARDPLAGMDDTPLLAARRKAFDSPTIANLDALIQAARDPYETVPGVQAHGALLNEIEDFRQITRELNMELNPGADSCPLPHTRALKISLTELWFRYYGARGEVTRIREALKQL